MPLFSCQNNPNTDIRQCDVPSLKNNVSWPVTLSLVIPNLKMKNIIAVFGFKKNVYI